MMMMMKDLERAVDTFEDVDDDKFVKKGILKKSELKIKFYV